MDMGNASDFAESTVKIASPLSLSVAAVDGAGLNAVCREIGHHASHHERKDQLVIESHFKDYEDCHKRCMGGCR